jgi:hypothetical protein
MERRKYGNKQIGTWSRIDSVMIFDFNNFNSSEYSKRYFIKKLDSITLLIGENETTEWVETRNRIFAEVEQDESSRFFKSLEYEGLKTKEVLEKEKRVLFGFRITAIKRVIADKNIFIRVN